MRDATPRMKALLAGGATVLVFGIIVPANATPDRAPSRTETEFVGQAHVKAKPKGQSNNDENNGFTCDYNRGAGQPGHPALPNDCEVGTDTEPPADPGGTPDGDGGGRDGGGDGGDGGEYSAPNA